MNKEEAKKELLTKLSSVVSCGAIILALFYSGYDVYQIADYLGLSPKTVRGWFWRLRKRGLMSSKKEWVPVVRKWTTKIRFYRVTETGKEAIKAYQALAKIGGTQFLRAPTVIGYVADMYNTFGDRWVPSYDLRAIGIEPSAFSYKLGREFVEHELREVEVEREIQRLEFEWILTPLGEKIAKCLSKVLEEK